MTQAARRLTILTLIMAIFALFFAELVEHASSDTRRVHVGSNITCLHPANPNCVLPL